MSPTIAVSDRVIVGCGQPNEADLEQLRRQGYKTIVNLRVANEDDGQLPPEEEGEKARSLGLEYLHIPVSAKQLRAEQVDEFRNAVRQLPSPVFVHCKSGKRSGAFAIMQRSVQQGWSGEEALRRGKELGFACDKPELVEFVRTYVDQRA